jgi:type I restriction-modification system DNA methylase subunit
VLQKIHELLGFNPPIATGGSRSGSSQSVCMITPRFQNVPGQAALATAIAVVPLAKPTPHDVMVDPACGTCGFPVAVGEYLREHFNHALFHGFDFDNTMLRIGAMNMLLHGVENPDVSYRDSLSEDSAYEENKYTLVLANPPFAGSLDYESTSGKLQRVVKTKKTERLFMALFLQLLKLGGRAAVIVPDGVVSLPAGCSAPMPA